MIDKFGNAILVGWSAHEMLWLEAAMSLGLSERGAAYRDIASMTGRTTQAVHCKAWWLRENRRVESAKEARRAALRKAAVLVPAITNYGPAVPLRQPSKAKLMGAR